MTEREEAPFAGQYRILQEIDCTLNSWVELALDLQTGMTVALKIIEIDYSNESSQQMVNNECDLLLAMCHPYVIKVIRIFEIDNLRVIVFPFYSGGDLHTLASNSDRPISVTTFILIMSRLVFGIHYLHSLGILHGDIKPENILLSCNNNNYSNNDDSFCNENDENADFDDIIPIITDLGYAVRLEESECGRFCHCKNGTHHYLPPEFFETSSHSFPLDIFCLGRTLELVATNVVGQIPMEVGMIIRAMLNPDPEMRPTSLQCLQIVASWTMDEQQAAIITTLDQQTHNKIQKFIIPQNTLNECSQQAA